MPGAIVAVTVPSVMPLTATVYVVGPPVTATLLVPPAVPPIVTPPLVKPLTGSLKTTAKLMGEVFVGSVCPAAWLIVTLGRVAWRERGCAALVDAVWP